MALMFLEVSLAHELFPIIYIPHQLARNDFCVRQGVGLSLKHFTCPPVLWYLERGWCGSWDSLVLLACESSWALSWKLQDCLALLCSNYFLQKNLLWKPKWGQNGDRIPESQPCYILRGNLFMPFTYWISMNFYQNNMAKAKRNWKTLIWEMRKWKPK